LITGLAAVLVAASVLYTLTRTGGPTEIVYLTLLILLVGSSAMRTPVFCGVVTSLAIVGAMGILVVTESTSVAQRGDWAIGLGVSVAAAVIVHRARVAGLRKLGAAQDDLQRIADVDELTGVTSRHGFSLAFPWLVAQAKRQDVDVFALFGDVDGLKVVNDSRGHEFGDQLIMAAANALREHSRASDLVVRWGGDEFLVIGMGSAPDLGRFESAVSLTMGALTPDSDQRMSMSMGAASLRQTDSTLESLITAADNDMMRRRRERGHRHSERATSF
jgi:diguanylate cyclase (GGDEF)-like protein